MIIRAGSRVWVGLELGSGGVAVTTRRALSLKGCVLITDAGAQPVRLELGSG